MAAGEDESEQPINWARVGALYAGLLLGIGWMLYWGDYRNAVWLSLIGLGGALTARGRILEHRGREQRGERWQWAGGVVYAIFFVWAGTVLVQTWMGA